MLVEFVLVFEDTQFYSCNKAQGLKTDLKKWNLVVFGNIDDYKCSLMEELRALVDGRRIRWLH